MLTTKTDIESSIWLNDKTYVQTNSVSLLQRTIAKNAAVT